MNHILGTLSERSSLATWRVESCLQQQRSHRSDLDRDVNSRRFPLKLRLGSPRCKDNATYLRSRLRRGDDHLAKVCEHLPKYLLFLLCLAVMSACKEEEPTLSAEADLGRKVFEERCAACHQIENTSHSQTAPSLKDIIGRKAATGAFNYSEAFRAVDFDWTTDIMLAFLEKPRETVPDNEMAFYGLENAQDRENLVKFLLFHSN